MTSAAKVGIVMLIALAVLGYFVVKIEDINLNRSAGTREIKAVFDDVAGLDDESAVRIAGVRKGHVTGIKVLPDGRAEVTMKVDDDIPLHTNASASVANLGLLGEKYIEIDPGTSTAPTIATTGSPTIKGSQPASIDEVTTQVSDIADDVKAITATLRRVMATPQGEARLDDIVQNVEVITREMRALIAANRVNVDATIANTRAITEQLRAEIPRLADSLDRVATEISGTVGENRQDVRQVVENVRGLSADLRVTADNLNNITGKMKSGEGTVGKLLYSDEAHERLNSALTAVESGVNELKSTLGRAKRMELELGVKADYLGGMNTPTEVAGVETGFGNTRAAVGMRLTPNPDVPRFYSLELVDDPRGKRKDKVQVDTVMNPATGQEETLVTTQTKFERAYLVSAQAGWHLDPALTVRLGLFESLGGVGADYRINDRLSVTGEAYDFGERRDDNPHLRLFGEYTVRRESTKTPRLFVTTGIDNALNDTAFIVGGGVRWTDDDIKYLLGSIPVGR